MSTKTASDYPYAEGLLQDHLPPITLEIKRTKHVPPFAFSHDTHLIEAWQLSNHIQSTHVRNQPLLSPTPGCLRLHFSSARPLGLMNAPQSASPPITASRAARRSPSASTQSARANHTPPRHVAIATALPCIRLKSYSPNAATQSAPAPAIATMPPCLHATPLCDRHVGWFGSARELRSLHQERCHG